jgi:hypothetical protein
MRLRTLLGVGAIAIATLATTLPADAAPKPKPPRFLVDGGGTYTVDATGAAVVTGDAEFVHGKGRRGPLPGTFTAVLSPADGTLPEPETCEPATATITVEGDKRIGLTLVGDGEVCGIFPQLPTYTGTHVFTGRYEVVDAERRRLPGTDGFFEIRLGLDNVGNTFAIDT